MMERQKDDAKGSHQSGVANGSSQNESEFPEDSNRGTQDVNNNDMEQSRELTPPPLPPRPRLEVMGRPSTSGPGSLRLSKKASRPQLLSQPTTALSLADVHTQRHVDSADSRPSPGSRSVSRKHSLAHFGRISGNNDSGGDDSASLNSYAPTLEVGLDGESLLGDDGRRDERSPAWRALDAHVGKDEISEDVLSEADPLSLRIQHEFDEIDIHSDDLDGAQEEALLERWKAKLKHFFILSASGKPIYSRHGDDRLISHYIGVAQTLLSFYQGADDALKSFSAGGTRFVMLSKGPLNLVAISRLNESEAQLRTQLESLYMQILSTLTLPSMEQMFRHRPSTDLRRPLEGTDVLLNGLADGFTRGSPSTLLSALECLRLRKTHRRAINDTLLKVRSPNLLYGLIVAAGRLVSVVRPKKHSLHPGDLHLIFNMLFEAGSVRINEGENWIPLCLPGFNNTGFLYMYVSFFSTAAEGNLNSSQTSERPSGDSKDEELAIVLISANKESFYELRKMRDELVEEMEKNGSMDVIKTAIRKGHATCSDIVPGTVLRHFLYKSRGNVQFTMPSFEPYYHGMVAKRNLLSLYSTLHESVHSRTSHLKVQHCVGQYASALAWETPLFELYCVAGPKATRAALAAGANKVVQWIRREEERVFIIGGGTFG